MRKRDPRRLWLQRRQERARVTILDVPQPDAAADGAVTSRQMARVTLPRSELDRIWTPEYLERLARTYWRFLTRLSLGLLRVLYRPDERAIVLLARPLTLLRFRAPEYEIEAHAGSVTWRIERGLLVAPAGRGQGYLRLTVMRADDPADDGGPETTVIVCSEVAHFYPTLRGWGAFSRLGRHLYRFTQLRIHVIVTHAFLRSLARLDLAPSVVGALKAEQPAELTPAGKP